MYSKGGLCEKVNLEMMYCRLLSSPKRELSGVTIVTDSMDVTCSLAGFLCETLNLCQHMPAVQ